MTVEMVRVALIAGILGFFGGFVAGVSVIRATVNDLGRQIIKLIRPTELRRRRHRGAA